MFIAAPTKLSSTVEVSKTCCISYSSSSLFGHVGLVKLQVVNYNSSRVFLSKLQIYTTLNAKLSLFVQGIISSLCTCRTWQYCRRLSFSGRFFPAVENADTERHLTLILTVFKKYTKTYLFSCFFPPVSCSARAMCQTL